MESFIVIIDEYLYFHILIIICNKNYDNLKNKDKKYSLHNDDIAEVENDHD